jgi:hypothetical protein
MEHEYRTCGAKIIAYTYWLPHLCVADVSERNAPAVTEQRRPADIKAHLTTLDIELRFSRCPDYGQRQRNRKEHKGGKPEARISSGARQDNGEECECQNRRHKHSYPAAGPETIINYEALLPPSDIHALCSSEPTPQQCLGSTRFNSSVLQEGAVVPDPAAPSGHGIALDVTPLVGPDFEERNLALCAQHGDWLADAAGLPQSPVNEKLLPLIVPAIFASIFGTCPNLARVTIPVSRFPS